EVLSHWKDIVEEVGPNCGISLYAMGEQDGDGNVIAIHEDRLNGADLVARPGLVGSGLAEKLYESAKAADLSNGSAPAGADQKEGESNMDELKALLENLSAQVTSLEEKVDSIVTLSESAAQQDAEKADVFRVADEITEAIAEAGLPAQGRKRVIESVKAGAEIADAVKAESEYVKAIAEAYKAETEAAGRVVEAAEKKFSLTAIAERA